MGKSGKVNIVNLTGSKLVLDDNLYTYQMNAWKFPSMLEAGKSAKCLVEWCDDISMNKEKACASAGYHLQNDSGKAVEIRMKNANLLNFTVEYTGFDGIESNKHYHIPWQTGDEMYITISETNPLKWMEELDDSIPLNKINIPGTHDSLAYELKGEVTKLVSESAKNQNLSIAEQLRCGCRFFDIRTDENLNGCHGIVDCTNGLSEVMSCVSDFLYLNNKETVLIRLKNERSVKYREAFLKKLNDIFCKYKNLFWKNNSKNEWPPLSEVRGKVVLLDDLDEHFFCNNGYGLIYEDNMTIQNDYNNPDPKIKLQKIENNILLDYNLDKMKMNYVSATGFAAGIFPFCRTPRDYADFLNPKVISFIIDNSSVLRMGIIAFDFIDLMAAQTVISKNFNH